MSMTSFAALAAESGGHGHEAVWELPIPAWSYGAIALAAFLLLLGIAWVFRNAGHTLMTAPDVREHGAPGDHGHGTTRDGHGSAH